MTAPSDYEALVEKAATVLRDEVIDAPRAAIIATRALEAAGLPALLERVEAAEGAYEYVVRERDEAIASTLAAAACPRCAGLKVGLWMDLCDDHLITQLTPTLLNDPHRPGGIEE